MTTPDLPQQPDPTGPAGPSQDVLGGIEPASVGKGRSRRRTGIIVGAAVAVLGVTGAGVATAMALSGGGAQPEDVLPGSAVAFVKLDLDPSAGQKLNAYRLSQKFPDASEDLKGVDSLRDDVLRSALEDSGIDYDAQVKPWIGDRAGIAVLPAEADEVASVVAAVAYTDRAEAEKALEGELGDDVAHAFVDDYVLLSDDQAVVDAAAADQDVLADTEGFSDAVEALDGDQVALAWTDLGKIFDLLPAETLEAAGDQLAGYDPSGQVVMGLHVEADAVEVVGRGLGVRSGREEQDSLPAPVGTGLVGELPAEAVAALSVAGLDASLAASYEDLLTTLEASGEDVEGQLEQFGLDLPEDLSTVLGSDTAVAGWGDEQSPEGLLRTRSDDPEAGVAVLRKVYDAAGGAELGPFDDVVQAREDGLAVGTPGALAADGETLSSLEAFTGAAPDADDASFVAWVDLQQALTLAGVATPDTEPLKAVGMTAKGTTEATVTMRLTFR